MLIRIFLLFFLSSIAYANPPTDPYQNLKFYYGDNHFHSGFSGDNPGDAHPLVAFVNAEKRVQEFGADPVLGDPTPELGGYFLFLSDHIKFTPTRADMTDEMYQIMRTEADDPTANSAGPNYTFTSFPGGELTGLARDLHLAPPWDSQFGHLNIFNLDYISQFTTDSFIYLKGTVAMDLLAQQQDAIGQFNHPGYNGEPRTGNSSDTLYPFTEARDRVFKFFEVTDGRVENWNQGVSQYNICLQKGYHVSPAVGSDVHDTTYSLYFTERATLKPARTVIIAPSTINLSTADRRKILLDAVRNGLVYVTENPGLHIKFSLNGFPIGHQFSTVPDHLTMTIDVQTNPSTPLQTIELVQNKTCVVADKEVISEDQCTHSMKVWTLNNTTTFHDTFDVDSKNLSPLKYIYLKVSHRNGNRAMTTPFFFY